MDVWQMHTINAVENRRMSKHSFMIMQLLSNNIASYIVLFRKFLGWVFFFLV